MKNSTRPVLTDRGFYLAMVLVACAVGAALAIAALVGLS